MHRFGSRESIIVDTVVVKDSREWDAYQVAREGDGHRVIVDEPFSLVR